MDTNHPETSQPVQEFQKTVDWLTKQPTANRVTATKKPLNTTTNTLNTSTTTKNPPPTTYTILKNRSTSFATFKNRSTSFQVLISWVCLSITCQPVMGFLETSRPVNILFVQATCFCSFELLLAFASFSCCFW